MYREHNRVEWTDELAVEVDYSVRQLPTGRVDKKGFSTVRPHENERKGWLGLVEAMTLVEAVHSTS